MVGMMAGVLHGALVTTIDLDIVHRTTPANITRLVAALSEMSAGYRDLTGRRLPPDPSLLVARPGHNLFDTRFGAVDALVTVGGGRDYEDLLPLSQELSVGEMSVRAITLEELIRLKQAAGRPKDLAALPLLRQTLAEAVGKRGQ